MSTVQDQLQYIERNVIYDVLKYFGSDAILISRSVEGSTGLDGFMSALYTVKLHLKIAGVEKTEIVLIKFMKGTPEFRKSSKSYIQFANEIFVYSEILPAYAELLRTHGLSPELVYNWVPRIYCAKFGAIEELSNGPESVLAMKHLKNVGFELGPRLVLGRDQLEAMSTVLGKYHAMGYALRLLQPNVHERLRQGVQTLPFVACEPAEGPTIYQALYKVAFARFFEFYDRAHDKLINKQNSGDVQLAEALERLRTNYFKQPEQLLERLRVNSTDSAQPDSYFSTFLHGDFNRNNVLFHYASGDGKDAGAIDDIKMIDFQELRYSTPAIDISFYMYMNTPADKREELFQQMLRLYHKQMYEMLELVVLRGSRTKSAEEDNVQTVLANYSFEKFEAHFRRYAFYGAMVCMHFMPWLLGSEEDCTKLSHLFETDMHGQEFYQLSIEIAGDSANHEIFKVVRHAFEHGYMNEI